MYQVGGWLDAVRPGSRSSTPAAIRPAVSRTVIALGFTSLFTDISSEMVASVLPIYLVGYLRMSPAMFGLVDGLYQGVAGFVQLGSALLADRFGRHKEVALLGYGASLLARVGLLLTNGAAGVTTLLTLDRLGKGTRSAPRDALISLSVPRESLGTAFGIHRAMDAVGALLGPVIAFIVLRVVSQGAEGFNAVFVVSLAAAIIGFATLTLLVENRQGIARSASISLEFINVVLRSGSVRHLALSAVLLGAFTISDGFIYLVLQRRAALSSGSIPLLYVLTAGCYLLWAIPAGRLADRLGRFPMFLAGHGLLVGLYFMLAAVQPGAMMVGLTILLLGLYYATTEGVLMALGSGLLPEAFRTSGLAVLTTALSMGRLAGSAVFGLVWSGLGMDWALILFPAGLAAAIGAIGLSRPREVPA